MRDSANDESTLVERYFDRHAADFDGIYSDQKPLLRKARDAVRGTVVQRLNFVERVADQSPPTRVLDVGCGSGRFALRLAARGADVVGLDFAGDMLDLARRLADEAGLRTRCQFIKADFLEWAPSGEFDLGLAIGVTDYVADPRPLVAKLAAVSGGRIIVSFPRRFHPLAPLRWARLRASSCPVHFYSRRQVEAIGERGVHQFDILEFGRDFLLIGGGLIPRGA